MTIPPELEAQILRYYHVEKWRWAPSPASCMYIMAPWRGSWPGPACLDRPRRPSQIDPYLPFIHPTLEKFPTLTASRLYQMVHERGYRGSSEPFPAPHRHASPAPDCGSLSASAHCRANRGRSTGVISAISKSAVPAGP